MWSQTAEPRLELTLGHCHQRVTESLNRQHQQDKVEPSCRACSGAIFAGSREVSAQQWYPEHRP